MKGIFKYVSRVSPTSGWELKSELLKQKSNSPSRFNSGILKEASEGEPVREPRRPPNGWC